MSMDIQIDLPSGLKKLRVLLSEELIVGLREAGMLVEAEAKARVPVRTGNLRRSIGSIVEPITGRPVSTVFASARYAPFVEFGTRPHTPPIGPLRRWARGKDVSAGAVWAAIRKRGTKPHPFMEPALEDKRAQVVERMNQAIEAALRGGRR